MINISVCRSEIPEDTMFGVAEQFKYRVAFVDFQTYLEQPNFVNYLRFRVYKRAFILAVLKYRVVWSIM